MDLVRDLLVVLHLLGMAAIVGGWLAVLKAPRVLATVVNGARVQVVTGVILLGLLESGVLDDDGEPNRAKFGVKLLVGIVVAGLAEANAKRGERVRPGLVHAIGGLAVLNVLIAVLWD